MFNSQDNQDKYLEENVFKGYKNGIFVDVGAHNGVSINNTLLYLLLIIIIKNRFLYKYNINI